MPSWLALFFVTAAAAGLGSLVVLQFVPPRVWGRLDGLFASLVLGVVMAGWPALVLAELNRFSIEALLLIWLATICVLAPLFVLRRAQVRRTFGAAGEQQDALDSGSDRSVGERLLPLLLILWLPLALWLFFRPHEYILGGADSGVYVSLGAEIAAHGGFNISDQDLAALHPDLQRAFLRPLENNPAAASYLFPGFYVSDASAGKVTPQFYPLSPVWMAVVYGLSGSQVDGVRAELLTTGLWMTLASLAIAMTARELGGWPAAVLMLAALSISALQVWFARYPTTEALTQFLLWSGLWAAYHWLGDDRPAVLWSLTAGAALGSVFLVRIDIIVLLPLFLLLAAALWLRGWKKSDWWFAVPFTILFLQSLLHGAYLSAPYFEEILGYALLRIWRSPFLLTALLLSGLLALGVLAVNRQKLARLERLRQPAVIVVIIVFLAYALYGWFVRPALAAPQQRFDFYSGSVLTLPNNENWLRLGWYLSAVGVWIGVAGICYLIWTINRRTILLVATGLLFTMIYLWDVQANPHQVYVMRRYVPQVMPFFLLGGAVFISRAVPAFWDRGRLPAGRTAGAALAALLALIWLGTLYVEARGFVRQVDLHGVIDQLAELDALLPAHSVLLFNDQAIVGQGDFWGTPLKYIFGHDAYTIRYPESLEDSRLTEAISQWQAGGRSVIWFGDKTWLDEHEFQHQPLTYTISSHVLESSYDAKPELILPAEWTLSGAFIEPR